MGRIGRARSEQEDLKLAFAYARFSTDYQDSVIDQHATNAEVADRFGVRIVRAFEDEAVSRTVGDRKGLMDMFAAFRANPDVRYLVVNELPRLTAGINQRGEVTRLCKTYSIMILTDSDGELDPHDEVKMNKADRDAVESKAEVIQVRRRTRRALRQKILSGVIARRPAYGIRMVPVVAADGTPLPSGAVLVDAKGRKIRSGKIEEHPDELPWLRQIFQWADEGLSGDVIAKRLNDADVPTKTGKSLWRQNTVGGILGNPLYKGQLIWGLHETKEGADEKRFLQMREEGDPGIIVLESPLGALVDPDVFDRIEARRSVTSNRRPSRRINEGNALDEFVFCGKCGYHMYGRNDAANYISTAKRLGKPFEQYQGMVIWRYVCNSRRSGTGNIAGFGTCEKSPTMPLKKILAAFEISTISAELPTGTALTANLISCPTCEVGPEQDCITKGNKPYRLTGNRQSFHGLREEMAMHFANERTTSGAQLDVVQASDPEPLNQTVARANRRREVKRLDELLAHNYKLLMDDLVPRHLVEAKISKLRAELATAEAELQWAIAERPAGTALTVQSKTSLGELARALRSELMPLDAKVALIRSLGINRIFVDDPFVRLETVS